MSFRFNRTPRFIDNFSKLNKKSEEIVMKQLKKIKDWEIQHIIKRSPFLAGEFAGVRHYSFGNLRLYFRVCKECRQYKHDIRYDRCDGCERKDDLINLIDIQIRKGNTYKKLKSFDKEDVKEFLEFN